MARKPKTPIGFDEAPVNEKPLKKAASAADLLTKKMNSLSDAIRKANAFGEHSSANKMANEFNRLNGRLKEVGGQTMPMLNASTDHFAAGSKEATMATGAMTAAVTLAAAAYGTLAAGLISATSAAYSFGSQKNLLEAQISALSRGGVKGQEVVAMLRDLGAVLPYTTAEMAPWIKSLQKAGVNDLPRLTEATKAAAAANAYLGDEGSRAITGMVGDLAKMVRLGGPGGIGGMGATAESLGLSLVDAAAKVGILAKTERGAMIALNMYGAASKTNALKIGNAIQEMTIKQGIPSMQAMNATWDVVVKKFKENAGALFNSIEKTEGFKAFALGLQRVALMLGGTSKGANAANNGLVGFFDIVFKMGAKFLEWTQIAALELMILGLKGAIALLPVIRVMRDAGGWIKKLLDRIDGSETATRSLKGLAVALGVIGALAVVVSIPFIALFAVIGAIVVGVTQLLGVLADIVPKIWAKAVEIGSTIWKGIVNGVKDGVKAVDAATGGVASAAINKVKGLFDSHSPSKVFEKIGLSVPQGLAGGIDRGEKLVHDSAGDMAKTAVAGGRPQASGGRAMSITVAEGAIVVQAAPSPRETAQMVEESFVSLVERLALSQGGG